MGSAAPKIFRVTVPFSKSIRFIFYTFLFFFLVFQYSMGDSICKSVHGAERL